MRSQYHFAMAFAATCLSISALAFFNVANRYTFSMIFKADMTSAAANAARQESVTEMILRFVAA